MAFFSRPDLLTLAKPWTEAKDLPIESEKLWPTLAKLVLPVLGASASIVAMLGLNDVAPSSTWLCSWVSAAVGLILVRVATTSRGENGLLIAAGSSMLLTAILITAPPFLSSLLLLSAPGIYGWLLAARRIRGRGSSLFLLATPLIAHAALDKDAIWVGLLLLPGLLLASVLLLRDRQALFASSALGGCLLAALPSVDLEDTPFVLVALVFLVAVGAMISQGRQSEQRQSPLRRFAGQGLIAAALLVVCILLLSDHLPLLGFMWFSLVTTFQAVGAFRRDFRDKTWVIWPHITAVPALWLWNEFDTWFWESLLTLAMALSLHHLARLYKNRFMARTGILLLSVPMLAVLVVGADAEAKDPRPLMLAVLTTATLLWLTQRSVYRVAWPWWVGFLSPELARNVNRAAKTVGQGVLKLPVLGGVAWFLKTGLSWLRYLKTPSRLALEDFVWIGGCLFGAWAVGAQLDILRADGDGSSFYDEAVWIVGGLFLLCRFVRGGHLYQRITALGMVLFPVCQRMAGSFSVDSASDWMLLGMTGGAIVAYAVLHLAVRTEPMEDGLVEDQPPDPATGQLEPGSGSDAVPVSGT